MVGCSKNSIGELPLDAIARSTTPDSNNGNVRLHPFLFLLQFAQELARGLQILNAPESIMFGPIGQHINQSGHLTGRAHRSKAHISTYKPIRTPSQVQSEMWRTKCHTNTELVVPVFHAVFSIEVVLRDG